MQKWAGNTDNFYIQITVDVGTTGSLHTLELLWGRNGSPHTPKVTSTWLQNNPTTPRFPMS